jgi:ribosomal protein S16
MSVGAKASDQVTALMSKHMAKFKELEAQKAAAPAS